MNKIIILLFTTVLILSAWWFWTTNADTKLTVQPAEEATSTSNSESTNEPNNEVGVITRQPSSPDRQVYINQDWRFSFEYPVGWEAEEQDLRSRAIMFEVVLQNENMRFPDPVKIAISPKWWIERLLPEIKEQKNFPATVSVDERSAIVSSFPYMGIPSLGYKVLVENEYWFDISGRLDYGKFQGYEKELNIVLDSFKFHEPMPYLKDLDVEPYIPDYVKTQPTSSD